MVNLSYRKNSEGANHLMWLTLMICMLTACLGVWQVSRGWQKSKEHANHENKSNRVNNLNDNYDFIMTRPLSMTTRHVNVTGRWKFGKTVVLQNRTHQIADREYQTGYEIYDVLVFNSQRKGGEHNNLRSNQVNEVEYDSVTKQHAILVKRGWYVRNQDKMNQAIPPKAKLIPTNEDVLLSGVLVERTSQVWGGEQISENDKKTVVYMNNLTLAQAGKMWGLPMAPYILEQTSTAQDGLLRNWQVNQIAPIKHYGYALQWFMMSLAIGAITFFNQRPKKVEPK